MTENTGVVVIGGGYAGVMAANRLTKRDNVTPTLINPRPSFVEQIRLRHLVGGSHDPVHDYREVLAAGVGLVVDTVIPIDAAKRSVSLATGGRVGYEYLIYAVGSGHGDPRVPGAAQFAFPIASLEAAARLWAVINAAPATAAVTVVGAGPTGIETAAELAEGGRPVTLLCGELLGPSRSTLGGPARGDCAGGPRRQGDCESRYRASQWRRFPAERGDHLDRRVRCAGPGEPQPAEH
jgi:NAD(P)H-nitrite reductase large subunit